MNFKISKILSGGELQNLCKFIKRRKNPAAYLQKSFYFNSSKKRLS